jgi:hypothetical protein
MMSADDQSGDAGETLDVLAFRLVSIERHEAPAGGEGNNWFEYKISQGPNMIRGYRRGSVSAVNEEVRKVVNALNERRGVRRGRVNLNTRSPARAAQASSVSS